MEFSRPLDKWTGVERPAEEELLDRVRAVHTVTGYALDGRLAIEIAVDAIVGLSERLQLWRKAAA